MFAMHTPRLHRMHIAKTFRGDVSEKFRCAAPRHPTRPIGLSLTLLFSFDLEAKDNYRNKLDWLHDSFRKGGASVTF